LKLGCATGHPSFVMSASFSNQVMPQLDLHKNAGTYEKKVFMLPKRLDEEVARLHLDHLGVRLTPLTKEQADYIGVPVEGPHYRYRPRGKDPGIRIQENRIPLLIPGSRFLIPAPAYAARRPPRFTCVRSIHSGSEITPSRPVCRALSSPAFPTVIRSSGIALQLASPSGHTRCGRRNTSARRAQTKGTDMFKQQRRGISQRGVRMMRFGSTTAGVALGLVAVLPLIGFGMTPGGQAKGKGGPPPTASYTSVTADFGAPANPGGPLTGDGEPYVGYLTPSGPSGAFFMTSAVGTNYFALILNTADGRHLDLDLTQPTAPPPPCATNTGRKWIPCRMPDNWKPQVDATWGPNGLHVVPRDQYNNELAGGMRDVSPVGAFSSATLLVNFAAADRNGNQMIWRLMFDFDQIEVRRTAENTWTIQTLPNAVAHLDVSPDGSATRRTDEGYYYVSFAITVTQ
jgi:hypothetical protein